MEWYSIIEVNDYICKEIIQLERSQIFCFPWYFKIISYNLLANAN